MGDLEKALTAQKKGFLQSFLEQVLTDTRKTEENIFSGYVVLPFTCNVYQWTARAKENGYNGLENTEPGFFKLETWTNYNCQE